MDKQRGTDRTQPKQERIDRTFNIDKLWYFEVRGGGQHGPYDSREEMENALNEYIALQIEVKEKETTDNN